MQLGKLRAAISQIRDAGAEVLAISVDNQAQAQRMAAEVGPDVVVLSDPSMRAIVQYGMQAPTRAMAEMGYVVIDAAGKIRVRHIDRNFGEHAGDIVNGVRDAAVASKS